jgi:hypothetical protein
MHGHVCVCLCVCLRPGHSTAGVASRKHGATGTVRLADGQRVAKQAGCGTVRACPSRCSETLAPLDQWDLRMSSFSSKGKHVRTAAWRVIAGVRACAVCVSVWGRRACFLVTAVPA